jgi:hypothetical protein
LQAVAAKELIALDAMPEPRQLRAVEDFDLNEYLRVRTTAPKGGAGGAASQ